MFSQSHLVLPFLSFPFRGKMNQAPISDPLKTPLSTWASVPDQLLLRLYLVQALLTATSLGCCCPPCVYGSSILASQAFLPSFQVWFGFTEPLSLSSQDQESSFGKPSLVLQLQAVCSLHCVSINHILNAQCSGPCPRALRVTGHVPPLLHCGCLSIHAVHLSLPRLEPPLPHLALSGVCLPRAALMVPVSFLSLLPLFCVFSAPPPGAKKERRRREKFIITRLGRSDFIHPFCLLHGVCLSIRCDTR